MKKIVYYCFAVILFCLTNLNGKASPVLTVSELKCENLINPNAIDNTTPHFSWKILYDGGKIQQQFY